MWRLQEPIIQAPERTIPDPEMAIPVQEAFIQDSGLIRPGRSFIFFQK
jgi:hypothetical protein